VSHAPPPPPPDEPAYGSGGVPGAFSISNAINYGWTAYWKNVGPMLVLTLLILVVNIAIGVAGRLTDSFALSLTCNIVGWIVSLLLALGLIRASLAVTRGQKPDASMLFEPEGFGPYIVASILFGLGAVLGFVLLVVPGLIFVVTYWFYGYVISDNPTMSATGALARAAELTRGHRWELFGLGILLLLLNIAGFVLCLVGAIFTYGITALTVAYAYRSLSGEPVAAPR
jgi:hypothetical protein